jgi:hypothetical protein
MIFARTQFKVFTRKNGVLLRRWLFFTWRRHNINAVAMNQLKKLVIWKEIN